MKKILLSFVLLLGGVLFANAQTSLSCSTGWGAKGAVTGDAVFNYKDKYGEVYADITEIDLSEYPSFEIVLGEGAPVDKLQIKITTDKGDGYSGTINTTAYSNAFTFAKAGSTKVTHLGLQACNVANLGNIEIKEWNLIDKDNNKIPLTYMMESWGGDLISPLANVLIFDGVKAWNYAVLKGVEGKYFPKFRFKISAASFPSNLAIKIKTTEHYKDDGSDPNGVIYRGIPTGTEPLSFDIDMVEGETITEITINIDKDYEKFTLTNVDATIQEIVPVEISEYEWATFVSNKALDFTGSDVKAYIVLGRQGTALTKNQITGTVPANTPLLLNAAKGNYTIPAIASSTTNVSANLLKAGTGSAISKESGKTKYVLGVTAGKAEFQKINTTAATVPTGKAYLEFNEAIEARSLDFDDEGTTAIKNMKVGENDNIYYDLQGRRVLYPKNGLYIVNGKKVIVK